jgi:hypothetical protein
VGVRRSHHHCRRCIVHHVDVAAAAHQAGHARQRQASLRRGKGERGEEGE